jgi:hypothetical protein
VENNVLSDSTAFGDRVVQILLSVLFSIGTILKRVTYNNVMYLLFFLQKLKI